MKKYISLLLSGIFLLSSLVSCASKERESTTIPSPLPNKDSPSVLTTTPEKSSPSVAPPPSLPEYEHSYVDLMGEYYDCPLFNKSFDNSLFRNAVAEEEQYYKNPKDVTVLGRSFHLEHPSFDLSFRGFSLLHAPIAASASYKVRKVMKQSFVTYEFDYTDRGNTLFSYSVPQKILPKMPSFDNKEELIALSVKLLTELDPDFEKKAENSSVSFETELNGSLVVHFDKAPYEREKIENLNGIFVEFEKSETENAQARAYLYEKEYSGFSPISYKEAETLMKEYIRKEIPEITFRYEEDHFDSNVKSVEDLVLDRAFYIYIGERKALLLGICEKEMSLGNKEYYEKSPMVPYFKSTLLVFLT